MSRLIRLLNNETIEILEYSKANACFQTNEYPNDELFCVIRETFNPFDLFQEKLVLEQEIERLHSIIKEVREYIAHYVDNEYRNGRDDELYLELNEKELKELLEILDKENNV